MHTTNNFLIEIATADFETTKAAVEGGADRIELCAALTEGGTTPSWGMIRRCTESFDLPIFPIIRPRSGDFLYSQEEYDCMVHDIYRCRELGCEGVVIGMLQKDGTIDNPRVARLIEKAYPMEVTFHRAFDRCRDPFEALELLIELGCNRILTSGQEPGAPAGSELIAQLVAASGHRIVIMPGSGVRKENIRELAEKTGATEFHSSLRGHSRSAMQFIHPAFASSEESYSNPFIDAEEVRALRKALAS